MGKYRSPGFLNVYLGLKKENSNRQYMPFGEISQKC